MAIPDASRHELPDRADAGAVRGPVLPRPFIPPEVVLPELTFLPLATGTLLGAVFGLSSLYLTLKVGITVSASIPVAVISITLFRLLARFGLRRRSILENNIVQTAGSAGESLAFGVGVTMPAIMILGFDLEVSRVMLVAMLGGLLGILMMIPLRRALIVQQHHTLKYPEGTACAEVLKAGASPEEHALAARYGGEAAGETAPAGAAAQSGAKPILAGFGLGVLYKSAYGAFKLWKDVPEKIFGAPFKAGSIAAEISPELLGVGYIIGPRIASIMCAGGVLAYLVLIPAIKFFGEHTAGIVPPGAMPIAEMDPTEIRGAYVLYIGAGAVAAGGIISLFRSLPTIWQGMRGGLSDFKGRHAAASAAVPRTEQDLSFKLVAGGVVALIAMIMLFPQLHMNLLGAILIVLFGFLFVTVSSRLTGEIGSSSTPISGMTVATLLLTCLIFLALGWTGPQYYVTALSVGALVCIAASNGGTISQDLKTGFLIGSTPRHQEIAILVGSFASALVLGPVLLTLNSGSTVYVPRLSFEPPTGAVGPLPGSTVASLPRYAEGAANPAPAARPAGAEGSPGAGGPLGAGGPRPPKPGDYRLLHYEESPGAAPGAPSGTPGAPPLPGLAPGDYLVDAAGRVAYRVRQNFPPGLRADPAQLGKAERLQGEQAASDGAAYRVWLKSDDAGGPAGRYLTTGSGIPVYLVDPGINGTHPVRPDGTRVTKFDAPKATLVSYIIKGILNRRLPWALVLLGVMISIVLEMSGIPSLAFAVGVYLPLSSSSPIFVGGLARWGVDQYLRRKLAHQKLTAEQLAAEADKSPGVLMASGYIAGGAIAGIVIAIVVAFAPGLSDGITRIMQSNPFSNGPWADLLALIPFALLVLLLYLTGRERILRPGAP
jgi:putative OPT family oligopeptide transporter